MADKGDIQQWISRRHVGFRVYEEDGGFIRISVYRSKNLARLSISQVYFVPALFSSGCGWRWAVANTLWKLREMMRVDERRGCSSKESGNA